MILLIKKIQRFPTFMPIDVIVHFFIVFQIGMARDLIKQKTSGRSQAAETGKKHGERTPHENSECKCILKTDVEFRYYLTD